jgi:hypothetical protein
MRVSSASRLSARLNAVHYISISTFLSISGVFRSEGRGASCTKIFPVLSTIMYRGMRTILCFLDRVPLITQKGTFSGPPSFLLQQSLVEGDLLFVAFVPQPGLSAARLGELNLLGCQVASTPRINSPSFSLSFFIKFAGPPSFHFQHSFIQGALLFVVFVSQPGLSAARLGVLKRTGVSRGLYTWNQRSILSSSAISPTGRSLHFVPFVSFPGLSAARPGVLRRTGNVKRPLRLESTFSGPPSFLPFLSAYAHRGRSSLRAI